MIDKASGILDALEAGPASLAQLVSATGYSRPTVHRLASALAHHRLLGKDIQGGSCWARAWSSSPRPPARTA